MSVRAVCPSIIARRSKWSATAAILGLWIWSRKTQSQANMESRFIWGLQRLQSSPMRYRMLRNFQVSAVQLGIHNLVVEVTKLSWLAHRISVRTHFLYISPYIASCYTPCFIECSSSRRRSLLVLLLSSCQVFSPYFGYDQRFWVLLKI